MKILFALIAALVVWYAVVWIVNAHLMLLRESITAKPYRVLFLTLLAFIGVGVAGALIL